MPNTYNVNLNLYSFQVLTYLQLSLRQLAINDNPD